MKPVPMLFEFWLKAHEAIDVRSLPMPNNHNVFNVLSMLIHNKANPKIKLWSFQCINE
jgi:hypothetical protein